MKKIFIDAGHGGYDSGATYGAYVEKTRNLDTALKLSTILSNHGFEVKLGRSSDIYQDLRMRSTLANQWGANLFISIHTNSAKGSATGVEVFIYPNCGATTNSIANSVQSYLVSELGLVNRGVKSADFSVLRETSMPAILVEGGFINNPIDMMSATPEKYALAIAKGVFKYYGVEYKDTSSKVFYRACVGSYNDIENAKKAVEQAKAKGFNDAFVAKYEV